MTNADQPFDRTTNGQSGHSSHLAFRISWGSLAAIAVFLLVICLAVWFGWTDGEEESPSLAAQWLSGMEVFLMGLYERRDIQLLLLMCLIGIVAERIIPARRQPIANYALNIPYSAMVLIFLGAIVPLQLVTAETVVSWIGWRNLVDLSVVSGDSLPLAVATMLTTALIIDFFFYWFHRCQHTFQVLWQVHMLHHSDMALNVTTTHRVHFFEHVMTPFFMIVPVIVLFDMPATEMFWIAAIPSMWSFFVHANLRIGFGRFWWLLSSPQYHRIHHSILPEHRDRNFAVWFPFYDVLFGTAYRPEPDEYPETGVPGVTVSSVESAFLLPFRGWLRMVRGSPKQLVAE